MKTKAINWTKYPMRTCIWMNECRLCGKTISSGQQYRDGGYGRRAHAECISIAAVESKSER
jgi:hypothetical protein